MGENGISRLRNFAAIGLIAALVGGFFIPVYTDEIGWRFQERAGFDGVDKLFSDICGPNTLAAPPFFMMPARYFSSILNSLFADPLFIRISGMIYAAGIVALALRLINKLAADQRDRLFFQTFVLSLLAIGMMPFLLVWSRPEQPILLCLLTVLPIALASRQSEPRGVRALLPAIAVILLWIVAISYHLKGLFLFPVFAACLFYASQRISAAIRLGSGAVFLALTASAAVYWVGRMGCPDSPILASHFAQNSLGGAIASVRSVPEALAVGKQMFANLGLTDYVMPVAPSPFPLSDWLERGQMSESLGFVVFLLLIAIWAMALVAGVAALVAGLIDAWRKRRIDPRLVLSLACLIAIVGWNATQNWVNAYEAPFVLVTMLIAIVLAFSADPRPARRRGWVEKVTAGLAVLALLNPLALAAIWSPSMARAASQPGYIEKQPYSVGLFGYAQMRKDIEAAAKLCRIPAPAKAQGLLLDEVTYFAWMESRLPQHRLGVLSVWNGEIDDPVAYLKTRKSDGMLLGCHLLDDDLRARAKSVGDICCLAPPDWGETK
jgi:hypothetical protein